MFLVKKKKIGDDVTIEFKEMLVHFIHYTLLPSFTRLFLFFFSFVLDDFKAFWSREIELRRPFGAKELLDRFLYIQFMEIYLQWTACIPKKDKINNCTMQCLHCMI